MVVSRLIPLLPLLCCGLDWPAEEDNGIRQLLGFSAGKGAQQEGEAQVMDTDKFPEKILPFRPLSLKFECLGILARREGKNICGH